MNRLDQLENSSIYILRTAYRDIKKLIMLWSIGKDSTVLLWLARKAFLGEVPFPLLHIDTGYKLPEMLVYRNKLVREWKLDMRYSINKPALKSNLTFPKKNKSRLDCCRTLKTLPLKKVLSGKWPHYQYDHKKQKYILRKTNCAYQGVIIGIRADEEGSRSKERYFSKRTGRHQWQIGQQQPEFWDCYNTETSQNESLRIHPLLDWTELDIWEYIHREKIKTVSLYYDQGYGSRYRSLGCAPCTKPIRSKARNSKEIIQELRTGILHNIPERTGRAQDKEDHGGLEKLRRQGYM